VRKIVVARSFRQDIKKIAKNKRSDIYAAIDALALWPDVRNVKALVGRKNEFRLRLGGYRIFFEIIDDHIVITHVRKRDERTY
jgi:mRNA-degrading endonuclease RelE of RelBE toxin-antitoxin system